MRSLTALVATCAVFILELVDREDRNERTGEYRVLRSTMVQNRPASYARH